MFGNSSRINLTASLNQSISVLVSRCQQLSHLGLGRHPRPRPPQTVG